MYSNIVKTFLNTALVQKKTVITISLLKSKLKRHIRAGRTFRAV